jgi:hypothetical protein
MILRGSPACAHQRKRSVHAGRRGFAGPTRWGRWGVAAGLGLEIKAIRVALVQLNDLV